MRILAVISLVIISALLAQGLGFTQDRQPAQAPTQRPRNVEAAGTQAKLQAPKSEKSTSTAAAQDKPAVQPTRPPPTAKELVEQGKQQYRLARFKQALTKFEAALKLDPDHDEALGLAGITAFRLDNQQQARDWFLHRAELSNQKDSVKAYSYYWAALTLWRQAHDVIGKHGGVKDGKPVFELSEQDAAEANGHLASGLDYIGRTLTITPDYAEAHNVKNLLHTEAAFIADDEEKAADARRQAVAELRKAMELYRRPNDPKAAATANFGVPTILVAEFGKTKDEEAKLDDPMMKLIEGGRPLTRAAAAFPSARPPKTPGNPSDPSATGVTAEGGAFSLGAGRGALNAAYLPGTVKVEVLVSTTGSVVFTHVVDGRSDLNAAAVLAAKRWSFAPAKFEGKPVQVSGVITFNLKPPSGKPAATPTPASKPPQ